MTQAMDNDKGLLAYDCSLANLQHQIIDLSQVKECDKLPMNVSKQYESFQLIQVNTHHMVHVIQCRVIITRMVSHCGMHSHASMVSGGLGSYMYPLGKDRCQSLLETGTLSLGHNNYLYGIKPNSTTKRSMTFAGKVDQGSSCSGAVYSDPYGTWESVIVQGTIDIRVYDYYAMVEPDLNKIHLHENIQCDYIDAKCTDTDGGEIFWNVLPQGQCEPHMFSVLYTGEGEVFHLVDHGNERSKTYFVESHERTFALSVRKKLRFCHGDAYLTEHPNLYIIPRLTSGYVFETRHLGSPMLDPMIYMNAKFIYMDQSAKRNLETLYRELVYLTCDTERKTLMTQLTIAYIDPVQFAFNIMGKPGYTALLSGQVAYIIKCQEVYVSRREGDRCYQELPVNYTNTKVFMEGRSRILQKIGTEIPCSHITPSMYKLQNRWWAVNPLIHEIKEPLSLNPNRKLTWEYTSSPSQGVAGIYSEADVKSMSSKILFHNERRAIENNIVQSAAGNPVNMDGISLIHAFNDDGLSKLSERIGEKIWRYFSVFGNISAGLFGIYIVFRTVKFICDTLIHGKALYTIYGWSFALLASFWDSLTSCLIHQKMYHEMKRDKTKDEIDQIEEQPIVSDDKTIPMVTIKRDDLTKPQFPKTLYPANITQISNQYGYHSNSV